MQKLQKFTYEWEVISKIHANAVETSCSNVHTALEKTKRRFYQRKAWLLRFFPADGRITTVVQVDEDRQRLIRLAQARVNEWLFGRSCITSNKLEDIFDVVLRYLSYDELLENRTASPVLVGTTKFPAGTKATKVIKAILATEDWLNARQIEEFILYLSRLTDSYKSLLKGARVVLSINPLDIVLMGESCSYQSCTALGHAYTTAPLAYLQDECTAIAYAYYSKEPLELAGVNLGKQPHKIWRQLIYFDKINLSAVLCRVYGNVMPHFEKEVRAIAADILASHAACSGKLRCEVHGEDVRWVVRHLSDSGDLYGQEVFEERDVYIRNDGFVYLDKPQAAIKLPEGDWPSVNVGDEVVPCLKCGELRDFDDTGEAKSLLCYKCSERGDYCRECGDFINDDAIYYGPDGVPLCYSCYEEHTGECAHCGGLYWADDLHETMNGWVCEECFRWHYFVCTHCNEAYQDSACVTAQDGNDYCHDCYEELYTECHECGQEVSYAEAVDVDGEWYCQACYYDTHVVCVACGQECHKDDAVIVDGEWYCEDCAAEQQE